MKLRLLIELDYDATIMYGDDDEARQWFFKELLRKDTLILHSNEIGDDVGTVEVLKVEELAPRSATK